MSRHDSYLEIPDPRHFLEQLPGEDKFISLNFRPAEIWVHMRCGQLKNPEAEIITPRVDGDNISLEVECAIEACISLLNNQNQIQPPQ